MRGKVLVRWLTTLTLLFLCLAMHPSQAIQPSQEDTPALELYKKWRKETLRGLPAGEATPHYSIAVITKKMEATSAKLEFAIVGEMSSYALAITPVNFSKTATGETTSTVAGEDVSLDQETTTGPPMTSSTSTPGVIIPIADNANGVQVTWTPRGTTRPISFTLILSLEENPSDGFLITPATRSQTGEARFIKAALPISPLASRNLQPYNCYWVQGASSGCGRFCKCCGTISGNTIKYTDCSITCGQDCPIGQSCGRIPDGCYP